MGDEARHANDVVNNKAKQESGRGGGGGEMEKIV